MFKVLYGFLSWKKDPKELEAVNDHLCCSTWDRSKLTMWRHDIVLYCMP